MRIIYHKQRAQEIDDRRNALQRGMKQKFIEKEEEKQRIEEMQKKQSSMIGASRNEKEEI